MPQVVPIYHITHIDNLPSILAEGRLWCDTQRINRKLTNTNIGHKHIKERRLNRSVPVSAKGMLGDYVPFNFCNRSVMLYVIYANSVEGYSGGQNPILHLVSSVSAIQQTGQPWAFTNRHAELGYTDYFDSTADLSQVDWKVMPLRQWGGDEERKEKRQAEFLVHEWCPWHAIETIATKTQQAADRVNQILTGQVHIPNVTVEPSWYY